MSTMVFDNDIINSVDRDNLQPIDASVIEEKLTKIETEWSAGTNTDFSINTGKVTNLNTAMAGANTIGTAALTTFYGKGENITGIDYSVVQMVSNSLGTVATGTTVIPCDNTIPQNTEGDEYMTLAITPTSATNVLLIDVDLFLASSATGHMAVALFQNAVADAINVTAHYIESVNYIYHFHLSHKMVAGSTSEITFKVRAGNSGANTTTLNGFSAAAKFGGVLLSNIIIKEYLV